MATLVAGITAKSTRKNCEPKYLQPWTTVSDKPHISFACYLHVGSLSPSISYAMLMRPNKAETAIQGCNYLGSLFFSGRFSGNARYQRGHSALFSGYNLPEHICAVF